jgi:hypothetical protein
MPIDILQRKVDKMSIRINTYRMGMRDCDFPLMDKCLSVFTKDENVAGLGGYIQPLESRIKGQHVWVFSDRVCSQDLHGSQVYDGQHMIFLSHHER